MHGTGGSHAIWRPVIELLKADREIIAVDLPGSGTSPAIPNRLAATNLEFADRVSALIDQLGLERPHVAGTSIGGHVALLLGAAGTARSVVAFSPTGFWNRWQSLYTRSLSRSMRIGAQLSTPLVPVLANTVVGRMMMLGTGFARPAVVPPADAARVATDMRTSTGFAGIGRHANRERLGGAPASTTAAAAVVDESIRDGLREVPTTIAWAEKDLYLPLRQAAVAKRALPDAKHVLLTGCGHLATWDNPALIAQLLRESHLALTATEAS